MDDSTEENKSDITRLVTEDNLLLKLKVSSKMIDMEADRACCALEYEKVGDCAMYCDKDFIRNNTKTPIIMINEDAVVDQIEMAQIESYCDRILTPEGNVKYKNYKILAPAPGLLRMYSPSGDIHTTPKKGKIVPKFDLFHDSLFPREKLLELINYQHVGSKELEAIIKPHGISQKAIDMIRKTNHSSMDERLEFLNTVLSPCPSSVSMYSDESFSTERCNTVSPNQESPNKTKPFLRSLSVAVNDCKTSEPNRTIKRQVSLQCDENNLLHMNLFDEMTHAEERFPRSYTPRKMTEFEYSYFHQYPRPVSSLSRKNVSFRGKPRESKKTLIRNFIQRNMIDRFANQEKLAKLALSIEEDYDVEGYTFVSSVRYIGDKMAHMSNEIKEIKSDLAEIHDDMEDDDEKVALLLAETKSLSEEIRALNYLDDLICLLNGDLDTVAAHKTWPFAACMSARKRNPNINLIV